MRKTDNRSPTLVDLVKDIVTEELDDVSVASLAPSRVPREPTEFRSLSRRIMLDSNQDALWPLVDKTKFGK
jgi:hypothetical protein